MAAPLPRGTRIGLPEADGALVLGVIVGPAFGEGSYRASVARPDGDRVVCVHRSEVLVEPRFSSLAEAAAAMRARDRRVEDDRRLKVVGGAF